MRLENSVVEIARSLIAVQLPSKIFALFFVFFRWLGFGGNRLEFLFDVSPTNWLWFVVLVGLEDLTANPIICGRTTPRIVDQTDRDVDGFKELFAKPILLVLIKTKIRFMREGIWTQNAILMRNFLQ